MDDTFTVRNGIAWDTETDDTDHPTAHIGAAEGYSTADLLRTIELALDSGPTGGPRGFDLAELLWHESDALGYVTVSLPVTTIFEGRLLLTEMETRDTVGFAEFQRAYVHPTTPLSGRRDGTDTADGRQRDTELTPNDPLVTDQYGPRQMRAYEAQELVATSDNEVTVVVIDSGIDPDHEDLEAQVLPNAGEDFSDGLGGDTDPTYPDIRGGDHGVHVSGIIAATVGNGRGVAGVAGLPTVSVQTAKIFGADRRTLGDTVARAIRWATDEGADVINMSIGGTGQFGFPSETVGRAIEYADANGTVCVAAAGNDGANKVAYPARHQRVVGVGAVDADRNVAGFSNHGTGVDVAAPGVRITSTLPDDDYGEKSGTSMAAPGVAGILALGYLASPDATPAELRDALRETAQSVDGAGPDEVGAGIPDAVAFVRGLLE